MNQGIFKNCFENTLMTNLTKHSKVVMMMDNSKYNDRYIKTLSTMHMKKDVKTQYWNSRCDPNKAGVIGNDLWKKYWKQSATDVMAEKAGYSVLQLPLYQCIWNPIEITTFECVINSIIFDVK